MYHLVNRHSVSQHAGDKLCVVPELAVELITQSLYRRFEPARVNELKIITFLSVLLYHFDDFAFGDRFRKGDTHFVVSQTGEDLIGASVFKSHERNPFVFLVLEAYHVAFQLSRTLQERVIFLYFHNRQSIVIFAEQLVSPFWFFCWYCTPSAETK